MQRLELGDSTARFEPVRAGREHHHRPVCDDCGRVEIFSDDALERALHEIVGRSGYSVAAHEVVLHGRCTDCAHT